MASHMLPKPLQETICRAGAAEDVWKQKVPGVPRPLRDNCGKAGVAEDGANRLASEVRPSSPQKACSKAVAAENAAKALVSDVQSNSL